MMPGTTPGTNGSVRRNWVVLVAAALAFALKVALALNTYGTNDVITWERHLAKIKDDGALAWYRDGPDIRTPDGRRIAGQVPNHPPFVISILAAWDYLARVSGLPFRFWLRFTSSLADIASLLLIWRCRISAGLGARPVVLLLIALSPVSIMVSGFHGNTDPLVVSILLLSIWLAESGRPAWLAGAVFGMAMNIKVVPILFAPAFLLYLRGTQRRIGFAVAASAVFLTGSLPYIAQDPVLIIHRLFGYDPALVIHRLFGYAPVTATWGLSQIGSVFLPKGGYEVYLAAGKAILLLIVLGASFWMNWGKRKPALFLQCGFIAFLFIFWTPGFGVQYLAWLVPWSAGLDGRRLQWYYALSAAFLFMKYTWWSRGFPWFLANSFDPGPLFWAGMLAIPLGLACWISVGAVAHKLKIRLSASA
ncbi:MAG: glycosyltransferase 87 family protein [Bryobacteraceae bacterium]|jgi:hypothetical protein